MNKYHNKKVLYDGIKFDSMKEAQRYQFLKMLERAGKIKDLKLQEPFELQPSFYHYGKKIRAIVYRADFVYQLDGKQIIEDVKGFRTKEYEIKKKMMLYKFGHEIKEV